MFPLGALEVSASAIPCIPRDHAWLRLAHALCSGEGHDFVVGLSIELKILNTIDDNYRNNY